jgi:hypothetical protein
MDYSENIKKHYTEFWGEFTEHRFDKGPVSELPIEFCILKFPPHGKRNMWTYATCGMSGKLGMNAIEIHMFSSAEYDFLVELLTVIAHYHVTEGNLDLGHTINFGCPWCKGSGLEYGLISLPYLDGPVFENLQAELKNIRFLWLIPITISEKNYKKQNGLEALEQKFDESYFNYLDPYRESVI